MTGIILASQIMGICIIGFVLFILILFRKTFSFEQVVDGIEIMSLGAFCVFVLPIFMKVLG